MIGKFGIQDTFNRIEDNVKWVDRYVSKDGKLTEEKASLIEACPFVGGMATVAKNWAKGYPCEWSEIGWAALDVADCALLIASLGASSAVTVGKSAATTTAKNAARIAVKNTFRKGLANGVKVKK